MGDFQNMSPERIPFSHHPFLRFLFHISCQKENDIFKPQSHHQGLVIEIGRISVTNRAGASGRWIEEGDLNPIDHLRVDVLIQGEAVNFSPLKRLF